MKKIFALILLAAATTTSARAEDPKAAGGGLDPAVISETVNRAMPMYQECVKKEKSAPMGAMTVKFAVSGEGKVTKAAASDSTLNNPGFEGCIVDAVKGLMFPEPAGHGTVDVTYPFFFGKKGVVEKSIGKKSKKK